MIGKRVAQFLPKPGPSSIFSFLASHHRGYWLEAISGPIVSFEWISCILENQAWHFPIGSGHRHKRIFLRVAGSFTYRPVPKSRDPECTPTWLPHHNLTRRGTAETV